MDLCIDSTFKKFAPLYILQILEKYTDENHTLTYEEICEKLEKCGFPMERKAVSRYAEDLKEIGFKIHGVGERDENGKKVKTRRGIWLEKDFSDENLQMLIDSVLYSKYISQVEAEALIKKIRGMGSATFQQKNKGIAKLSSVYHAREAGFFKELNVVQQAIVEEKKIAFQYGKYQALNGKIEIIERENTVSPYHLVFSNGKYYLIGYLHEKNQIGHFRVDRIFKAKLLSEPRKPDRDTELNGISIGDYLLTHPNLFTGKASTVVMKVNSSEIGHVIDTFGENFTVRKSDKLTTTIELRCNQDDAFYWALQFSGIVEVLAPQALRERLRVAAEELLFRYTSSDTDRYEEALRKSELNADLDLTGIKLGDKTQHHKLFVKSLTLSDNEVSDIAFVGKYDGLCTVKLFNNPITDLSPLVACERLHSVWLKNLAVKDLSALTKMKALKCLDLEKCEDVDGSAIYQMEHLEELRVHGSIKNVDIEELKKANTKLHVRVYEERNRMDFVKSVCSEYPLNVLKESFGYNHVLVGDKEEATEAVDKLLLRLPNDEYEVAELVFKENLGEAEISDILAISVDEIARRRESYKKKFKMKAYNRGLEKFIAVKNSKSTNALEHLWDMAGIPEEKRPAYQKNKK